MTLSLFDEYPVSEKEISDFLDTIPNLSASPFRREMYRRAYRVEDKIRMLKKQKELNGIRSKSLSTQKPHRGDK